MGDMSIPLQFASLYKGQEVFVWSNCFLNLAKIQHVSTHNPKDLNYPRGKVSPNKIKTYVYTGNPNPKNKIKQAMLTNTKMKSHKAAQ